MKLLLTQDKLFHWKGRRSGNHFSIHSSTWTDFSHAGGQLCSCEPLQLHCLVLVRVSRKAGLTALSFRVFQWRCHPAEGNGRRVFWGWGCGRKGVNRNNFEWIRFLSCDPFCFARSLIWMLSLMARSKLPPLTLKLVLCSSSSQMIWRVSG